MADQLIAGTTLVEKESRSIGDVPIGGIVSWAKTLAGVPNLPENYRECNGSVIVDALSAMNGQTLPDLNGNEFLMGGATSGATGGSSTMTHTHPFTTNFNISTTQVQSGTGANIATTAHQHTGTSDGASNTENRPKFYTVVWVMRIR